MSQLGRSAAQFVHCLLASAGITLATLATSAHAQAPTIVTPILPTALVGQPYNAQLVVGGTPAPSSVTITGLPSGLAASHLGSGGVRISGTPIGSASNVALAIAATNSVGSANLTATLPLAVATPSPAGLASISAGSVATCAVVDGGVQCWGYNQTGFLGNGISGTRNEVTPIAILPAASGATHVAGGSDQLFCAVVAGGVRCWGANGLGNGSPITSGSNVPVQTIATGSGATKVAVGYWHGCAVVSGGLKCWGSNDGGQLGNGTTTDARTPIDTIPAGSGVTDVAVTSNTTCVVQGGAARCWGRNTNGELGNGTTTPMAPALTPVAVNGLATGVTAISGFSIHFCAIQNGGVVCWGANQNRQVQPGSSTTVFNTPQSVLPANSDVVAIAAGNNHTCAATRSTTASSVRCWGQNSFGQIGNGNFATPTSVVTVFTSGPTPPLIAAGGSHTCATRAGALQCWGDAQYGQTGTGDLGFLTPTAQPAFGSPITQISAGLAHTCWIASGAAQCVGNNGQGQLNTPSTSFAYRSDPNPALLTFAPTAISAGAGFTCAVVNGGVKCWGTNSSAQLGNPSGVASSSPADVIAGGAGATAVATSNGFACAIVAGGVRCWGANGNGQTGSGAVTTTSPTPVPTIAVNSGVTALATGTSHACAVANGGVQCWGSNFNGQLGTGSTSNTAQTTPVQAIPAGSGVTAIAAGGNFTCAIINAAVQCWGANSEGQLGDGSTAQRLTRATPVGSGATFLHAAQNTVCAVVNGGLRCWGANITLGTGTSGSYVGYLGDGSIVSRSLLPVNTIPSGSNVTAVSVGSSHVCALVNTNAVCWGGNHFAQQASTIGVAYAPTDVRFAAAVAAPITITATATEGGTISPAGTVTATRGDGFRFTLTPNTGFRIESVGGTCGGTLTENVYLTRGIDASCTVIARFTPVSVAVEEFPLSLNPDKTPATLGEAFTLAATAIGRGATGMVNFYVIDSAGLVTLMCEKVAFGQPVGSGGTAVASALCPVASGNRTRARHTYLAALLLGSNTAAVANAVFTQYIRNAPADLGVAIAPVSPNTAQTVVLTATVSGDTPSGTVRFSIGGVDIANCIARPLVTLPTTSGAANAAAATCELAPGALTMGIAAVSANYSGDARNAATSARIEATVTAATAGPTVDYSDLWWAGKAEDGWGMSISQRGNVQFNAFYIYDSSGKPTWVVMPGGTWDAGFTTFSGALYQPNSAPLTAYDPSRFVVNASVGTASIRFSDANTAVLTYNITSPSGTGSGTKNISRQPFGTIDPAVRLIVNGLWWNQNENGWGIAISQQARTLFATWYTYGSDGKPTWIVMPGGAWNGSVFTGDLYTTTSGAWIGVAYTPTTFAVTKVGTVALNFSSANAASMTYTVNGVTQTKLITRQPY